MFKKRKGLTKKDILFGQKREMQILEQIPKKLSEKHVFAVPIAS